MRAGSPVQFAKRRKLARIPPKWNRFGEKDAGQLGDDDPVCPGWLASSQPGQGLGAIGAAHKAGPRGRATRLGSSVFVPPEAELVRTVLLRGRDGGLGAPWSEPRDGCHTRDRRARGEI